MHRMTRLAAPLVLAAPILFGAWAAPLWAYADDEPAICADRPGKATPPCIVPAGRLQIETALADALFLRAPGQHEDVTAYGATEVRLGLTDRLETEAAWSPVIVDHPRGGARVIGSGDATFGLRYLLTDPKDADGVQVSAQGYVNAPTATHGLGEGGWSGGVRLPVAGPLPANFTFGLTPQLDVVRNVGGGGTHLAESVTFALARGFGDNTFGLELWGQNDGAPGHATKQASFDLFAARVVGKATQLDGGVNLGLNHDTPTTEVYVGISHRF